MDGLTIGEVARRVAVNVETLRYYERRKLLPLPPRSRAGYRRYPLETVKRVRFIKRAQELGFSLKEIRDLLLLRADPHGESLDVREAAVAKIASIEKNIVSLEAMRAALRKLVAACSGHHPRSQCPILEALDGEHPF
ncbi:MAG: MerR family DNA-binding protein [Planctomycetota bacterium]